MEQLIRWWCRAGCGGGDGVLMLYVIQIYSGFLIHTHIKRSGSLNIPVGYKWNWWNFGWLKIKFSTISESGPRAPRSLSAHTVPPFNWASQPKWERDWDGLIWWMFGKLSNSRQKSHNCQKSSILTVFEVWGPSFALSIEHVRPSDKVRKCLMLKWTFALSRGHYTLTLPPT